MIAAHPTRASDDALRTFLENLSGYVREFDSEAKRAQADVDFIKEKFGYPEEDITVSQHCSFRFLLTQMVRTGVAEDRWISIRLFADNQRHHPEYLEVSSIVEFPCGSLY